MKIKIFSVILLLALLLVALPMGSSTAQAAPCYQAKFIADVTIPDGTRFDANTTFTKTWRLKNIGACAWTSGDVSLIFDSGERMNAPAS
ncbi:MAG TPA: NBR1-Ig-like domain-containing protein, partial [Anaerolineales bacterium]|nr:NBR1-Ig-like domain-containing protein [Anaerolineales bacterium]